MKLALAACSGAALALAGSALAADKPLDTPLAWVKAPSAAQVNAAWPAAAKAAHAEGKVMLQCKLQADGPLRACKVLSEEPANAGFGHAAVLLARQFIGYTTKEHEERDVRIPIAFNEDPGTPKIVIGPLSKDYQPLIAKAAADKSVTKADVTLDCKVGDKGAMTGCKATSESPAGLGVGELAVQMSPKFISTLWGENGRPTMGASIRIPLEVQIRDSAPGDTAAPPAKK
ncbi:MAG TPA: TonB family protein [Caulobacteraceae bacterium]|nr:TonB family protein [Caulobacteraceae bacterium]